jgi:hypothetical protein
MKFIPGHAVVEINPVNITPLPPAPTFRADFVDPWPDMVELRQDAQNSVGLHDGKIIFSIHEEVRIAHEIGHMLTLRPVTRWYRNLVLHTGIDFHFHTPTTPVGLRRLCRNEIVAAAIEFELCARYGHRVKGIYDMIGLVRTHMGMNYAKMRDYWPTESELYSIYRDFVYPKQKLPSYPFSAAANSVVENYRKTAADFIAEWGEMIRELADYRRTMPVHSTLHHIGASRG